MVRECSHVTYKSLTGADAKPVPKMDKFTEWTHTEIISCQDPTRKLDLVNLYVPPEHYGWSPQALPHHPNAVICGDLNAFHRRWAPATDVRHNNTAAQNSSSRAVRRGHELATWMANHRFRPANTGAVTWRSRWTTARQPLVKNEPANQEGPLT